MNSVLLSDAGSSCSYYSAYSSRPDSISSNEKLVDKETSSGDIISNAIDGKTDVCSNPPVIGTANFINKDILADIEKDDISNHSDRFPNLLDSDIDIPTSQYFVIETNRDINIKNTSPEGGDSATTNYIDTCNTIATSPVEVDYNATTSNPIENSNQVGVYPVIRPIEGDVVEKCNPIQDEQQLKSVPVQPFTKYVPPIENTYNSYGPLFEQEKGSTLPQNSDSSSRNPPPKKKLHQDLVNYKNSGSKKYNIKYKIKKLFGMKDK